MKIKQFVFVLCIVYGLAATVSSLYYISKGIQMPNELGFMFTGAFSVLALMYFK